MQNKTPFGVGGSGGMMGSVTNDGKPARYDALLFSAHGSRAVWAGSSAAPTGLVTVDTLTTAWNGMPLCVSGAFDGERCGLTTIGGSHCDPGYGACGMQRVNGTTLNTAGQGDSGGPLYVSIAGTTYGVGIVLGAASTTAQCTDWASFGARLCSKDIWTTSITDIQKLWGITLD